ncbi:hypothetical protein ACETRX_02750 [Labrys portucalensis]|uniref:Uncharacterized protein n=1 Tax=Labrys neptuniae TaxID=376174 RepID=A0ABV6Z8N1_9HYPH
MRHPLLKELAIMEALRSRPSGMLTYVLRNILAGADRSLTTRQVHAKLRLLECEGRVQKVPSCSARDHAWAVKEPAPIPVRDRYYLTRCEHCGWRGSSEQCPVYRGWDDADVGCPACHQSFLCDEIGEGA